MSDTRKPSIKPPLAGALAGVIGSFVAYTALDPYHVAWLWLRLVEGCQYTAHGWFPARNFRLWDVTLLGLIFGSVASATQKRSLRAAFWIGAIAGFVGRLIIPLPGFIVE
jgi:hypothetical protein